MDCIIDSKTLTIVIPQIKSKLLEEINKYNIKYKEENDENNVNNLVIRGNDYIDFLGRFNVTGDITTLLPNCLAIDIFKEDEDAIIPSKVRLSDVGIDLTIIKKHKTVRNNIIMYDTGIKIQVPVGFYVEVVPRSSLIKTGWMLANSVGIIDNSYTGNIFVVVARIDPDADELPLPFTGFQLIVKKQWYPLMQISKTNDLLPETSRGAGGFGSTNHSPKDNTL